MYVFRFVSANIPTLNAILKIKIIIMRLAAIMAKELSKPHASRELVCLAKKMKFTERNG